MEAFTRAALGAQAALIAGGGIYWGASKHKNLMAKRAVLAPGATTDPAAAKVLVAMMRLELSALG